MLYIALLDVEIFKGILLYMECAEMQIQPT